MLCILSYVIMNMIRLHRVVIVSVNDSCRSIIRVEPRWYTVSLYWNLPSFSLCWLLLSLLNTTAVRAFIEYHVWTSLTHWLIDDGWLLGCGLLFHYSESWHLSVFVQMMRGKKSLIRFTQLWLRKKRPKKIPHLKAKVPVFYLTHVRGLVSTTWVCSPSFLFVWSTQFIWSTHSQLSHLNPLFSFF